MANLDRAELIAIVRRIMDADGTESEIDALITTLESNVPHPSVSDLIFWPQDGVEPTAEQVVDVALAYRPIVPPAG